MVDHTDEQWEEIGRSWREAAGMQDALCFDAQAFVRWLKHNGYIVDYVCVPDDQMKNAEGKYEPQKKIVYYRESVWRAAGQHVPHAVWTVLHEPCHSILHHTEVRYRTESSHRIRYSRDTSRDEANANRLAASILAPFDQANYTLETSVEEISRRFGLSVQAATRRRNEFERLYRRMNNMPRELPHGVVDFLSRQKQKGFRVTSLDDKAPLPSRAAKSYDGDACPSCGSFSLVRSGLARICDNCGAQAGDD